MNLKSDTWIIQNHEYYNKFINDVKVFEIQLFAKMGLEIFFKIITSVVLSWIEIYLKKEIIVNLK